MAYVINVDLCNGCGLCGQECPLGAIQKDGEIYLIDAGICTECGSCADVCPLEAVRGASYLPTGQV